MNTGVDGVTTRNILRGKWLNRLRDQVFQCRSVSFAEIAFQACSFNHSDISRCLGGHAAWPHRFLEVEPDADDRTVHRRLHNDGSTRDRIGQLQVQDVVTSCEAEVPHRLPVHADGASEINVGTDAEPAAFGRSDTDTPGRVISSTTYPRKMFLDVTP